MTTNGIINKVAREMGKEIARDALRTVLFDTIIEAQFIKLFSKYFLPR